MRKFYMLVPVLLLLMSPVMVMGQNRTWNSGNKLPSKSLYNNLQPAGNAFSFSVPSERNCGAMEQDSVLRAQNPELGSLQDFENWLQEKISAQNGAEMAPLYTIPVIVHVIHNSTESVGQGRNISQAQVMSQITALNNDFRRLNADASQTPAVFTSVAADVEIEFCPAAIDPNGNTLAEPGIHRIAANTISGINNTSSGYSMSQVDTYIKPATSWNPSNYMNIWVCQLSGSILGYAQFPSSSGLTGVPAGGAANTDGIVIGFNFFGTVGSVSSPFNKGRTATHEVGHWLGLRHIWGDSNCGSDYCNDTPVHNASNYGCPNQPHNSTCPGNPREMTQNYMDYTDDGCMNLFTQNQKTRMRTVMQNSPRRASLLNSTVCNSSAPPVTDFTASATTVTQGAYVTFTDLTSGNPSSWSWTFGGGGTPNTSTQQHPVIQFNATGIYTVSLTATNANGNDTETKTSYITVTASTGCDTVTNLTSGSITAYYIDTAPYDSGYVSGNNAYGDLAKADIFALNAPNTHVTGGIFYFARRVDNGAASNVTFAVWDNSGTGGTPGAAPIATKTVPIMSLSQGVTPNTIYFDSPVPVTNTYYMGVVLPQTTGDTVVLYTSQYAAANINTGWELWNNNTWVDYETAWGGLKVSNVIFPLLTDVPPGAGFSASDSTICAGDQVTFSSAPSTNGLSYSWSFQGGTPATSTSANPTITYNTPGNYTVTQRVYGACGSKDTLVQTSFITVTSSPAIANNITDVSCNGASDGAVTASVTGGTTPYSYSWSTGATIPTITGLTAGSYTLTVTDGNGCSSLSLATVVEPAILTSPFTVVNESCGNGNGSVTANPAGGTAPFTYSWNTGGSTASITNLSSGSYIVTITDANGCQVTDTAAVTNSGSLALSTTFTNATCGNNNGTATANPGGTSPYTYNWSNGGTTQTISNLAAGTYMVTVTDGSGCSSSDTVVITNTSAPVATSNAVAASCNGTCDGSATVVATGGTSPYSYSWNSNPVQITSTATGLCAGNYIATITDANGCQTTSAVTISQPVAISLSTTPTHETCNSGNGSISAAVTGGTGPYSYSWNTNPAQTTATATGLSSGVYLLTVTDANGCQSSTNTTLINLGNTTVVASNDVNICSGNNASLSASASGGTGPYTYQWSSGQTSQNITVNPGTSTTYVITATDNNGCADTDTVVVTVTQTPVVSASSDTTICGGLPVVLTANGASNYTWFPGGQTSSSITVSPTTTTTYTVVGANGSCQGNPQAVVVTTLPNATAIASANPTTVYISQGAQVQFTSTSLNTTSVHWDFGDGFSSTQTNPSHSYAFPGTYQVILTAFRGSCEHYDTLTIQVLNQVGIDQENGTTHIRVFPNPANHEVTISLPDQTGNAEVKLFDQTGRLVLDERRTIESHSIMLNTTTLANGVYYLTLTLGDMPKTIKLVINH